MQRWRSQLRDGLASRVPAGGGTTKRDNIDAIRDANSKALVKIGAPIRKFVRSAKECVDLAEMQTLIEELVRWRHGLRDGHEFQPHLGASMIKLESQSAGHF